MDTNTLRRKIKETYRRTQNWQKTADEWGLKKGTAYKIAMYPDYEPKDHIIRHNLGLPALVEVPPCSKCGELHLPKYCRNSISTNGAKSKTVSIGKPTPDQLAIIMKMKPQERLEAMLPADDRQPDGERLARALRGWTD